MTKVTVLGAGILLTALGAACVPVNPSGDTVAGRQALVEQYAAELPWDTSHITYRVESEQTANSKAISDCPTRTVRLFPSAFSDPGRLRWIVAHETGHQRDCLGLPAEFYALIEQYGAITPHSDGWNIGEGLADCLAKFWLGYNQGNYWDCPDEVIAQVPRFAPN